MKVKLKYETKRVLVGVDFENPDSIDRTKLAKELGLSKQHISYVIKTGNIRDMEMIEKIKSIPEDRVKSTRKMPGRDRANS